MRNFTALLRLALPVLFWLGLALVTLLALMPGSAVPPALLFWDKAQHSLAFALLAINGCLAFPRLLGRVCLGLLLHGIALECLQSLFSLSRYGDIYDALADGLGVVLGYALYKFCAKRRQPGPL